MEWLNNLNIESFAAIAALTASIIGLLKRVATKHIKGKEPYLALLLPLAFTLISKGMGNFVDLTWVMAALAGLGMGLTSSLIHDKVANLPMVKKLLDVALGMLKKKGLDPRGPLESLPKEKKRK